MQCGTLVMYRSPMSATGHGTTQPDMWIPGIVIKEWEDGAYMLWVAHPEGAHVIRSISPTVRQTRTVVNERGERVVETEERRNEALQVILDPDALKSILVSLDRQVGELQESVTSAIRQRIRQLEERVAALENDNQLLGELSEQSQVASQENYGSEVGEPSELVAVIDDSPHRKHKK